MARKIGFASFVDLYYNSPSNKGDSELSCWSMDEFYAGVGNRFSPFYSLGVFYRRIHDRIDWFKEDGASFWQVKNIDDVYVSGVESMFRFDIGDCPLTRVEFVYDYENLAFSPLNGIYKYSSFFIKHRFLSNFFFNVYGWKINLSGEFRKPGSRDGFFVVNFNIKRRLNDNLEVFLRADNAFNKKYYTLDYIEASGRMLKAGIKLSF